MRICQDLWGAQDLLFRSWFNLMGWSSFEVWLVKFFKFDTSELFEFLMDYSLDVNWGGSPCILMNFIWILVDADVIWSCWRLLTKRRDEIEWNFGFMCILTARGSAFSPLVLSHFLYVRGGCTLGDYILGFIRTQEVLEKGEVTSKCGITRTSARYATRNFKAFPTLEKHAF